MDDPPKLINERIPRPTRRQLIVQCAALVVIPLLAGIGLSTVVDWLPEPWNRITLVVIVLGALVWAVRELRWTRRQLRDAQARMREWR